MPKTWWRGLAFLFLCLVPSQADTPETPKANPFLWEAKHETGTAYLFGTIHIPDPRVMKLPPAVETAFARSDVVLTEIEFDPGSMARLTMAMMLPKGQKLSNMMTPELAKRINAIVPIVGLDAYQPWAATLFLTVIHMGPVMQRGEALDKMFPRRGKAEGKEIGALETVEEQVAALSFLSEKEQIKQLEKTLELIEKDRKNKTNTMLKLIDFYLEGDADQMMKKSVALTGEPDEIDKKFMKRILDDRNVVMADRLAAKMKAKPGKVWFVAVGAGHYSGEMGVGKLLAKKGFTLRRMAADEKVPPKAPKKEPVPPPKKERVDAK
ncbi:MAG: TraB/GumN family protein [Planctomycetota bacterium]|jgi:uncharacterized protein YbaP (TraB family)